jgi:hypothetical protein
MVSDMKAEGKADIARTLQVDWLGLRFEIAPAEQDEIVPALVSWKLDPNACDKLGLVAAGPKLGSGAAVAFQALVPDLAGGWLKKPGASIRVARSRLKKDAAAPADQDGKQTKPPLALFVDIHPPGLTAEGAQHVREWILDRVLNRSIDEIAAATVMRLDVALDFEGVALDRYAWDHARYRTRSLNAFEPQLRSIRLGSMKHGTVAVYDKSAKGANMPSTRAEARLRPHCRVQELPGTAGVFRQLVAYDVRAALASLGRAEPEREAMLDVAQLRGLKAMARRYPASGPDPLRPKVEAALAKSVPTWWTGEITEEEWRAALVRAFPAVSPIASS